MRTCYEVQMAIGPGPGVFYTDRVDVNVDALIADLYEHYRLSYIALNYADMSDEQMAELAVVEDRLEKAIGRPDEATK